MIKPEESRMLAKKYNLAVKIKDEEMINKILKVKISKDITEDIRTYGDKEKIKKQIEIYKKKKSTR